MNRGVRFSLALLVTLYTALLIAGAMAGYSIYEYMTVGPRPVLSVVFQHAWHVVALSLVIYGTLYVVLHFEVVRPLRALSLKLYAITRGDFSPLLLESHIREIIEIMVAEGKCPTESRTRVDS